MTPTPDGAAAGLDLGTSGCRAAVVDAQGAVLARGRADWPDGRMPDDPQAWWAGARQALGQATARAGRPVTALAVDGTSGTVLWAAPDGTPLTPAMPYDAPADAAWSELIARHAPQASAAHGRQSGLARALQLAAEHRIGAEGRLLSQAGWIAARLSGDSRTMDEHNALKIGYDPVARCWPDWLAALPLPPDGLPTVHAPGRTLGEAAPEPARWLGLAAGCRIVAGTTDAIAGFLAASPAPHAPGRAVTALGTTLALKLVTEEAVFSPQHGVYSHRLGDRFLAGGASNCGAGILARYLSSQAIEALTPRLDPERDTGLDYYPLPAPGERFPHADPSLEPRLTPRPDDDATFLQGLMEGIAAVEAAGFRRLAELGAPWPERVATTGGGAANPAWLRIRARYLGVPIEAAAETEAAVGAARLALRAPG